MNEQTEKRMVALVTTIANRCETCYRRNPETCRNCVSSWANSVLSDYQRDLNEQKGGIEEIDYSLAARMAMILGFLRKAGRPLCSHEMNLADYCTRQLKRWTLLHMMRLNLVGRTKERGKRYAYYLIAK